MCGVVGGAEHCPWLAWRCWGVPVTSSWNKKSLRVKGGAGGVVTGIAGSHRRRGLAQGRAPLQTEDLENGEKPDH